MKNSWKRNTDSTSDYIRNNNLLLALSGFLWFLACRRNRFAKKTRTRLHREMTRPTRWLVRRSSDSSYKRAHDSADYIINHCGKSTSPDAAVEVKTYRRYTCGWSTCYQIMFDDGDVILFAATRRGVLTRGAIFYTYYWYTNIPLHRNDFTSKTSMKHFEQIMNADNNSDDVSLIEMIGNYRLQPTAARHSTSGSPGRVVYIFTLQKITISFLMIY